MIRKTQEINARKLEWLEFPLLQSYPKLKHAVFTRHGGASYGSLASLNTSFDGSDKREHVIENRNSILTLFQNETQTTELISIHQVHGDKIVHVLNETEKENLPQGDIITSNLINRALLIKHADCQATIIYDPEHHAVANIHAGWKGSVKNVYKKTVLYMKEAYGSHPEKLIACISPSLGPEKAEFQNYQTELPMEFWPFQIKSSYFDFWKISLWQLRECGLLEENIEIANICTYSSPEDFFSYRRDKTADRNATVVCLL